MSVQANPPAQGLTWNFYIKGPPPGSTSKASANTAPSYSLNAGPPIPATCPGGPCFRLQSVSVTVSLDRPNCWVVPSQKGNTDLLIHEQGHWILDILVAHEMEQLLLDLREWTAKDLRDQATFSFNSQRNDREFYLGRWYDKDTNHGLNKAKQSAWNAKLQNWLAMKKITEQGPVIPPYITI